MPQPPNAAPTGDLYTQRAQLERQIAESEAPVLRNALDTLTGEGAAAFAAELDRLHRELPDGMLRQNVWNVRNMLRVASNQAAQDVARVDGQLRAAP